MGARAQRAFLNMMETLPIFAIAVLVTHVAGATNGITAACAQIYVIARVIYVPVYLMGIPWLRTAIWLVATLSIVILLLQAVL